MLSSRGSFGRPISTHSKFSIPSRGARLEPHIAGHSKETRKPILAGNISV